METSQSKKLKKLPRTWKGSAAKANAAMSVYGGGD